MIYKQNPVDKRNLFYGENDEYVGEREGKKCGGRIKHGGGSGEKGVTWL